MTQKIINPRAVKYLTNKELLAEIARCKKTFCTFVSPEYADYDMIVSSFESLSPLYLDEVLAKLNHKLPEGQEPRTRDSLVVRMMTYDHIPLDPDRKRKSRATNQSHARTNFPPFKHYAIRIAEDSTETWEEVGRSHWDGDFETGKFNGIKGKMTERLGKMFMMLVDRYSSRSNWRGYCVDETTETLTKRGWLTGAELTEQDTILSHDGNKLAWSEVRSIYRDDYDGDMFRMTAIGFDALVTPNHKWVTDKGIKPVDHLLAKDRLILMGAAVDGEVSEYSDAFVELVGWVATEGSMWAAKDRSNTRVSLYQNESKYAIRIRNCFEELDEKYSTTLKGDNIRFLMGKELGNRIESVLGEGKSPLISFMVSLSENQRRLLLNTMIDGDGWRTIQGKSSKVGYAQKSYEHINSFTALCTMLGIRTTVKKRDIISFGKPTQIYNVNLFSNRRNVAQFENVDLHGGKKRSINTGRGKINHPNIPTEYYRGTVWCPETEYGCFVARRNGTVYLTGNSYREEMCGLALTHLSQVGLQFDESKSNNPFSFFTTTISHCFTRTLNLEKKNQSIRDDLLVNMGMTPSHTRQIADELAQSGIVEPKKIPGKRGRKSAATIAAEREADEREAREKEQ